MKRRIAQFTIALAAVAMLSACIVINTTEDPALAPASAPTATE